MTDQKTLNRPPCREEALAGFFAVIISLRQYGRTQAVHCSWATVRGACFSSYVFFATSSRAARVCSRSFQRHGVGLPIRLRVKGSRKQTYQYGERGIFIREAMGRSCYELIQNRK